MNELTPDVLDKLTTMARAGLGPQKVEGGNHPYVMVPDGFTVTPLPELVFNDLEKSPRRIQQAVEVLDPESFLAYFAKFSTPETSVFADEATQTILAVIDYHAASKPAWLAHKLTLKLRQSEEWAIWIGKNNFQFTQAAFAEFLEQHSLDIKDPAPAAIIEIANDLQAKTEVEFGSSTRLPSGQVQFKYSETVRATVGAGQVTVPDRFTIQIPAFVGGKPVAMEAFLRFRMKEGKLTFFYTLRRPHEVIREAFQSSRVSVQSGIGDHVILNGKP